MLSQTTSPGRAPLDNTRSVVFELNGSLKVESVERNG